MAGQSFVLRKPLRDTQLHTKLDFIIPYSYSNNSVAPNAIGARMVITPDGFYAQSTTITYWDTTRFNYFATLYEQYMVTFIKVEYFPGDWPSMMADR